MLARGRIVSLMRLRGLQALPIFLLLALLGPPVLQGLPSAKSSSTRKLGPTAPSAAAEPSNAAASASRAWWGRKPTLSEHLQKHCLPLQDTHRQLLEPMLQLWNTTGFSLNLLDSSSGDRVYIKDGKLALSNSTTLHRLIPTFVNYIQHIAKHVQLPDLVLPLNPADEPLARLDPNGEPGPLLAFCKTPGFSDILIPNTIEGDVYNRPSDRKGDRKKAMSGPQDRRKPMVVWRGTTGGFGGLKKGRSVMLDLGLERPDLVDSGVADWNEEFWGPDNGRLKPAMTMREQVNKYKYQAWLPGNCASVRLALQLAADSAVFKVENDELEWYYPLLKPYVHYIPIVANETHTNLFEQLEWAEANLGEVKRIVAAANEFARQHLSGQARDCYFLQLLSQYHELTKSSVLLPKDAQSMPPYVQFL